MRSDISGGTCYCAGQRRQGGAATLIVVMVLFFIMSMVAAYTSRNLIFEQRTSANQLRSTQAAEAAEAGLQWALGLLNAGRINANCVPSTNLADTTFRQRYLYIDGSNGHVTPRFPQPHRCPSCSACPPTPKS
ncbi:MAG: pilus assembly PilX N-terminal domain-containing protein [Rubrivivax sp.]|nr:pilus assembly PilX N-terminal domain-containing protein [Rubrivivax sp.]